MACPVQITDGNEEKWQSFFSSVIKSKITIAKVENAAPFSQRIADQFSNFLSETQMEEEIENQKEEETEEKFRMSQKKRPNMLKMPASSWNIKMFSQAFDYDLHKGEIDLSEPYKKDGLRKNELFLKLKEDLENVLLVLKPLGINIPQDDENAFLDIGRHYDLLGIACRESGARLILDVIFQSVCKFFKLKMLTDHEMKTDGLPPARIDYVFYNKYEEIVGAAEAKSIIALNENSVVQAIIQLMTLQRSSKARDNFFSILSDGVRYIFIMTKRDQICFETYNGKIGVNKLILSDWRDDDFTMFVRCLNLVRQCGVEPECI